MNLLDKDFIEAAQNFSRHLNLALGIPALVELANSFRIMYNHGYQNGKEDLLHRNPSIPDSVFLSLDTKIDPEVQKKGR